MADPTRPDLPFEPGRKKKKKSETPGLKADTAKAGTAKASAPRRRSDASIPEVVSQRMFRRMIVFSGAPTALGVVLFFISYFLIVKDVVELPKYAVLLSTAGCFGLGVLGLSYGALSASWDESRVGGWLGAEEFRMNFPRLTAAWQNAGKNNS